MADVTRLVRDLSSYAADLERHQATVTAARQQLERSLARLSQVYEGVAAREFDQHWTRTVRQLQTYGDGIRAIRGLLVERLTTLEALDRPEGL